MILVPKTGLLPLFYRFPSYTTRNASWYQSGERIRGRDNLKAMQDAYPGPPPTITVRRFVGSGDVWVVEARSDYSGRIYYGALIIEFHEGKIIRETRYYADPFEAPAWRAQWVEPIGSDAATSEIGPERRSSSP